MKRIIILLFLLSSLSLNAETLLKHYIRAAIQKSPLLQSSSYNSRERNNLYTLSRAERLPRIQITPKIDQLNHASFQYLNYSLNIALSLNLSKTLSTYADISLYLKKKAEFEQRLAKQRLVFQIKNLYFELLIKDREKHILENAIAYLDSHLQRLKHFSKYGAKTYRLSLMRIQAERSDRTVQLNMLENRISALKLDLTSLSGISDTNTVLNVPAAYKHYQPNDGRNNFISVQIIKMQRKALASAVKSKKLYWLPKLSLNAGYFIDNDPTGNGNHFDITTAFNFPFPDLGLQQNGVKALQNREKKIEFLLEEAEREAVLKYQTLKLQITHFYQNYRMTMNAEKNLSDSLKLAKTEFKEGMINEMDILITLKDARKRNTFEIMEDIRKKIRKIFPPLKSEEDDNDEDAAAPIQKGIDFEMFQVLPDRLGDLTGKQKQVVIKIYGNNFKDLKTAGLNIKNTLVKIKGMEGVRLSVVEGEPEFIIKIKKNKAAALGLSSEQIGELSKIAIWGDVATKIKRGLRLINVRLRYPKRYRKSIQELNRLPVYSPLAGFIPLKEIADVKMRKGEDEIIHENGSLLVTVTGEIHNRDLGSTVKDIKKMMRTVSLPFGVSANLSGEYASQISSFKQLLFALLLAGLLVFAVLLFEFENYKPAVAVFLGTIFSFCFVIIGLWATGTEFNISSFAGLITVLGIVVNNGILLIDFTIRYEKEEFYDTLSALIKAGEVRLRPILITNLTTIAGFLPIALNLTKGSEILAPFAITVIFGLFSSILFSLIVIPLFYCLLKSEKNVRQDTRHPS